MGSKSALSTASYSVQQAVARETHVYWPAGRIDEKSIDDHNVSRALMVEPRPTSAAAQDCMRRSHLRRFTRLIKCPD